MATKKKSSNKQIDVVSDGGLMVAKPNLVKTRFHIWGTAPYVQNKFSGTKKDQMLKTQQATKGTSRKAKSPRDIESDYQGAIHLCSNGSYGIPAPAFRCGLISACRVAGLVMTKAKLSVFCEADDVDEEDGTPLVFLIAGEPEMTKMHVRLESGVASIAVRPMWREWEADVPLKWDADQFSEQDVANLLERVGQQVGIGEGRHDSKKSNGMGWGTFTLLDPR
jgi:hypothetical protein